MIIEKLNIKPFSVNKSSKYRTYKSNKYKAFEVLFISETKKKSAPEGKLKVQLEFGVSNDLMDIDNAIKPCLDCMERRHDFNDNRVYELKVVKKIVEAGKEFISYRISKI